MYRNSVSDSRGAAQAGQTRQPSRTSPAHLGHVRMAGGTMGRLYQARCCLRADNRSLWSRLGNCGITARFGIAARCRIVRPYLTEP